MATRIITVKRRKNPTNLPDHVYAESKRRIGSTFTSNGDVYTGLSFAEQHALMPYVVGVPATDPSFIKEVKDYFRNLTVEVPLDGVLLEAGTDESGSPLNVMEFVKYKFVVNHPHVAKDMESIAENRSYKYYIYDAAKEKEEDFQELGVKKNAYKEFIKLSSEPKKMDMVIRLYLENPNKMDSAAKELFLEKVLEENPAGFLRTITDKDLEMRSFLEECITKEAVRKVGNAVLVGDEKIGDSVEEAILFLKDKKNSDTLTTLKARAQQFS